MKCSTCGKELKEEDYGEGWSECSFCKSPICSDCIRHIALKKKDLYKEYVDLIEVCGRCTPREQVKRKLSDIVDDVLGV